jgi:undecaprenyl phosphate N,N'-diacetylbacillosamine 1-phosphate transferase
MYTLLKAFIDRIFAVFFLLLAFPLISISAMVIWLAGDRGSPFILQDRIGLDEQPFKLIKLRTMKNQRFDGERKLSDAERMIPGGRFFRKWSIDELPQLINVLKGEMSFIGPRPMPVAYREYFRPSERIRHSVRPGLSGLAQVSGRNRLTWDEKFSLDVDYVNRLSLRLDSMILLKTIEKLLQGADVTVRGRDSVQASLNEVRKPWKDETVDARSQHATRSN